MYIFSYTQKLPLTLQQCWDFFSSPHNLKIITPEHLQFKIRNHVAPKMYAGQIISYTIRPICNIPMEWITEITHVHEPFLFIDEQRFGPYKFWHHEHRFQSLCKGGVEMIDTIYYTMPFGFIGKALHAMKVKRDIQAIFAYRQAKLNALFGLYSEE